MSSIIKYQDGCLLAYTDSGSKNGFPVLVQHGMIASIDDTYLFDRLLQTGARVISIARPGYGKSSPYLMKDIAEWGDIVSVLVDELRLPHFDVLGISSGAPYSYAIGNKLSGKVRNLFILSGTPALHEDGIVTFWPYPIDRGARIEDLQVLARKLFFSNLSDTDLLKSDIRDSMMNGNCSVGIPDKCLGFRKLRIYETLDPWEGAQHLGAGRYLARRSLRRTGPDLKRSSR